jgi:thioredoxin reductase
MKDSPSLSSKTIDNPVDVCIVGAGPYGLSIAAFLADRGVSFRIFGEPMVAWANQMPAGMSLKSEGFASSLADPASSFTLAEYCRQQQLPYQDTAFPVPLKTFIEYGLAFQRRFVPNLERKKVVHLQQCPHGFELCLEDGEKVIARKVVLAMGITQFAHIPRVLSSIPADFVTHSSAWSNLEALKGREVAVIGAGASALDLAALLHKAGASVRLIARGPRIRFHNPPRQRTLRERIFNPTTGIGFGLDLYFYVTAPHLFRRLPERVRLDRMGKTLGPAPGWFVRDDVVGKVPLHLNSAVLDARLDNGKVMLQLSQDGQVETRSFDHVIAATGYRVDVTRMAVLSREVREALRLTGQSPLLSAHFESSVPGLYFAGVASANTFGPMMRFAFGARFTAQRLSGHLAKATRKATAFSERTVALPVFATEQQGVGEALQNER